MKKQSFVISAIILALGGFLAKGIGALYKIPLTNILGSNGMGIYYLIFPLYSLIITFCSSGISVALATEVAKMRKLRQRYNEQKLLRTSLVISFLMSLIFTILMVIFSKSISSLQGNTHAYIGYIAIAPSIIISSIIATLRGYFQGIENMIPTTVSLIIEQVIKLSVGLVLAHVLCGYGVQYAVLGAILGVTLSEVVALIIISFNFFTYKGQLYFNYKNALFKMKKNLSEEYRVKQKSMFRKNQSIRQKNKIYSVSKNNNKFTTKAAIRKILKISIPAMLSSIAIPIATMLDSFMIINILVNIGYSSALSTSLYGLSGGVVQSLISLPIIIVAAISTSLVPSLSGIVAKNDTNEITYRVSFFIKLTWILSIPMFVLFFAFAENILMFLYGNGLNSQTINELAYATKMLQLSSISIIYYAFLQTFTAILQTINKSHIPFIALLIGLFVRTGLIYVLVSIVNINIYGVFIANIIFLSIASIILAYSIKKNIAIEYRNFKHLFLPLIAGGIMLISAMVINWGLRGVTNYFWSMIVSAGIVLIMYILIVYFGGAFNSKEIKYISFRKTKLIDTKKTKRQTE